MANGMDMLIQSVLKAVLPKNMDPNALMQQAQDFVVWFHARVVDFDARLERLEQGQAEIKALLEVIAHERRKSPAAILSIARADGPGTDTASGADNNTNPGASGSDGGIASIASAAASGGSNGDDESGGAIRVSGIA